MQEKSGYTFLFDIENSLGTLSVFKMNGYIEKFVNLRVKDVIVTECRGDSISDKIDSYKYVVHFFCHICFPTKKANSKGQGFNFKVVDRTLTIEEIDDFSKQYIKNDKHLNQLVTDKKVQLKENESQFEFLHRLMVFKNTVFNQEAYEVLIKCAKEEDFKDWDKFRSANERQKIYLNDANLNNLNLSGIDFGSVHLEGAQIFGIIFKDANLMNVHLDGAMVYNSDFSQANMIFSFLKDASFNFVNLSGTNLLYSRINSNTSFLVCDISKTTDMELANWETAQYDPGLKQLVEKINRKKKWEEWYNAYPVLKFPVNFFWWLTDYGTSITRLIFSFLTISLLFALLYHMIPGVVDGLQGYENHPDLRLLRTIYFSIVTMTTLGFGDIHAISDVSCSTPGMIALGHILLIIQVLIGYLILGALITFFGILFKAPGPIQPYSESLTPEKRLRIKQGKTKTIKR